jgi:hypothetical protein
MVEPDFSLTPPDHVFSVGDEVYFIDENKVDLFKATIAQKYPKGYLVRFADEDEEDKKVRDNKRLLLCNTANNAIFRAQEKLRRCPPPPPAPKSDSDDDSGRFIRKKPRPVILVLSPDALVQDAVKKGIRGVDAFRTHLRGRFDTALKIFDTRERLLNADTNPLFRLGGNLDPEDVQFFWKRSKAEWVEMFGTEVAVPARVFVKKAAETFSLPNQDIANAREVLNTFLDIDRGQPVNIAAFCGLLATFGPSASLMRKLKQYLECPEEARAAIQWIDMGSAKDLALVEAEEGNSFEADTVNGSKIVYNLVTIDADGRYLLDSDGKRYSSWTDFCTENPPATEEEEEAEETPDPK